MLAKKKSNRFKNNNNNNNIWFKWKTKKIFDAYQKKKKKKKKKPIKLKGPTSQQTMWEVGGSRIEKRWERDCAGKKKVRWEALKTDL